MRNSPRICLCFQLCACLVIGVTPVFSNPPAMVSSVPSNGSIDAGQVENGIRGQWSSLVLTFDSDAAGILPTDFLVNAPEGLAPSIVGFMPNGNSGTLLFDQTIPIGTWTNITFVPTGSSLQVAHLPGDVNGDGFTGARDALALVDALNSVGPVLPLWATDIDRSGVFDEDDLTAIESLLAGSAGTGSWNGASLPGGSTPLEPPTAVVSRVLFELVPASPGPYLPGQSVNVAVWMHSQVAQTIRLRLAQLDTIDSNPALVLNGPDVWPPGGPNGIREFVFDFSTLAHGFLYFSGPDYPLPAIAYLGSGPITGAILVLPANGSLRIGHIQSVTLPMSSGSYTLDVMNSDSSDPNQGATIQFGFGVQPGDPVTIWRAFTGDLTGGTHTFVVSECVPLCDDDNPCTDDVCVSGSCVYTPNDLNEPDDGVYCNGTEDHCSGGEIVYSSQAPDCNDSISCTTDSCNEGTDSCDNVLMPGFCVIDLICHVEGDTNPSNECERCQAAQSASNWSPKPTGSACGDPTTTDCDSADLCDGAGNCTDHLAADGSGCPSDGAECTFDVCQLGLCTHPPKPIGTQCGNGSSTACDLPDACDGQGACSPNYRTNGTLCSNDNFCDGTEACFNGLCQTGVPPDCDDGVYCNGVETCDPLAGCIPGVGPCGQISQCDEDADACMEQAIPTVSTWGLIVLGLCLMVGARIRFGRLGAMN